MVKECAIISVEIKKRGIETMVKKVKQTQEVLCPTCGKPASKLKRKKAAISAVTYLVI